MHLEDAAEAYLLAKSSRCSPTTIKTDRAILDQFLDWLGNVDVTDVHSSDVRDYLSYHRDRGLSAYTLKRHYATLSALYSWLTDPDIALATDNPTDAVQSPKLPQTKPKALSKEEIESLVEATKQGRNPRRDYALLTFLVDTGARSSEVCGVELGDVDLKTGKVLLRNTKGSKERFVYMGRRCRLAVLLYVKEERPEPAQVDSNRLFLTETGYPMTRHTLRSVIRRLARRVGIHATTHQFRHAAAVERLRAGMDLVSLQFMLGHSDISTTREYLNSLRDEDVEKRAKRTSPSDNWRL